MIVFKNVKKTYPNGTDALNGVDIKINDGEFVFITGPSGAGKSTMIRLLTCEDVPSEGKLTVDGTNIKRLSHRQVPKYRRKIGVVFQDFRLIPTLNVFDNVAFAMRVVGRGGREIKSRVMAVLKIVGLEHKISVFPEQLSGGEQQRVALARAIVNSPSIIIADEPTGNVDPEMSIEIMKLLSSINRNGVTVVVVTHEQRLVRAFKKREIRLKYGKVEFDTGLEPKIRAEEKEEEKLKSSEPSAKKSSDSDKKEVPENV